MFEEFDKIVADYCGKDVKEDDDFIKDIKILSIDFIDMIMDIEKTYKITINEVALKKINTVKDMKDYVEKAVEKKKKAMEL